MSKIPYNNMNSVPVDIAEVKVGKTAVLNCPSNDFLHNFNFWQVNGTKLIGPGNKDFDDSKYKYEVLSGKLHVKAVTPHDGGVYRCFSKRLDGAGQNVGEVQVLVEGGSAFVPEVDTVWDALKLAAIVVSIIVIIGCVVLYIRFRREWKKYDGRTVVQGDDADEEEADEIYNRTTTTKLPHVPTPVPGPSRNASSDQLFSGIDNQGLDTDFNSVFENIQIKSSTRPLISM